MHIKNQSMSEEKTKSLNFIEQFIEEDIANGKHGGRVHTRFPPEPNGYLHIGHVKAICINFELAQKYGGITNLRFDDTNPTTEETEFVDSIRSDIHWLGFDWDDREYYASDYFGQLYDFARDLIKKGLAYVDDSTPSEMADMKGTPTVPGKESPYRNRSIEENMTLFEGMKNGEFPDGTRVLRAKIDMAANNMHMRDPVMYRIKHEHHHRTGDDWCIYPMYDFAHGQSDSIEEITHSLCSLEFTHHRPLYDWFIEKLEIFPSRQIEFARMNVSYMITSKRKLKKLVEEGHVDGWDDPRMPTVAGMRRRGYPPEALRVFCDKVGVAKRDNTIEIELLESCVRDVLNQEATRTMVVLDPIKVTITNYPDDQVEMCEMDNNPEKPETGAHEMPFSKHLFIEADDFMVDPPRKYFRLGPGRNVRLKGGYIIHCEDFKINPTTGKVDEVFCTYYPDSKSGEDTSGVKAKGTLHWVSQAHAVDAEVRRYGRLFTLENPQADEEKDFLEFVNDESLVVNQNAKAEPFMTKSEPGDRFQFMRKGYYCIDESSTSEKLVFNQTVSLKEGWKK
jgi:glutaminyl-tRNA synthetase